MRQFNTILAATDFTIHSKAAVKHAFDLARELGATVHVVHVINQRDIKLVRQVLESVSSVADPEEAISEYSDNLEREKMERLENMVTSINPENLPYSCHLRFGVTYQQLLKAVSELEADLLIMGSIGVTDLADAQTGSTTLRVIRRSTVPVVTVRDYKAK